MRTRSPASGRNSWRAVLTAVLLAGLAAGREASAEAFTLFESGQVRPLALSPSGRFLYAVNTPDNRLEIFQIQAGNLTHRASVPVGLEPVAVAARSDEEVWVVNHLSDSVSVVRLNALGTGGAVVRTLLVGDEPRDIVFAGPGKSRAFITAAHRGQNAPFDPQLTTPGIGRADVWVFDANVLGTSLGGAPLTIVSLFSDTPRALAVTPDGSRVYAAAFHSGNRTTVIHESLVPNGGEAVGGVPGPNTNFEGVPGTEVSVIVKFNGQDWVDVLNRPWTDKVRFSLPDKDVFVIDATANPPAQLSGPAGFYSGVGTILFNMAVNPVSGKVYVSNTEARNDLRFEGPGLFAGSSLRGHLHESRISVLSSAGVAPRHLNKHINYNVCCAPIPNPENEKSLAQPMGMAVSSNGSTLYVAAFGSSKIGVYPTAALEADTFVPSTANQILLSGGGPTGMVLDESCGRMYVLTRFDNAISVVDTTTRQEIGHLPMYNPEPASVVAGRPFLYDARKSSSHGDSSCASCHIFGDFDSLTWDLGNPDAAVKANLNPVVPVLPEFGTDPTFGQDTRFHPLKGPLSTQSLRGMANHGPMHWRGDRTAANEAPTAQPDSGAYDEVAAFKQFNPAFMDLLGRNAQLTPGEMQKFSDFILQVMYPPNPIRNLDNSLTPAQQAGKDFFVNTTSFFQGPCESCHRLDPHANPEKGLFAGFFGTDGRSSFDAEPLFPKVPHLRNMYQKVGMFGAGFGFGSVEADPFLGDQVRGIGFNSDGAIPTLFLFNSGFDFHPIFNTPGIPVTPEGTAAKRNMELFMLAFDSNLAPIVGQQVTLTATSSTVVGPRINLLLSRANAGECDLVAKGRIAGKEVGFLYLGNGQFASDRQAHPSTTDVALRASVVSGGGALTYTCTPPGSGRRIGIDRDLDGFLDGDERVAGSSPADPHSTP
ncbi:beta-propeller fold lactonase family protein [Archangium violaceum]|uniref:beta-propeller fold lactonase family protein n=1 Tax=Archangium violaceum TaxID=83451 RepID=UPI00194E6BEC|nr:beta-propeller fold lactonase family protein [Archangium violaceum]QRN94402.1 beta-propeller fold lactonase family protein [Archangium violaceum]